MGKTISLRAFAIAMGVAPSAVQKARDSGRIPVNRDGTVDPVRARRAWRDNTLHSKRPPRKSKARARRGAPPDDVEEGNGSLGSMSAEWHRARAAREAIQARLLQLDLEQRQGKLLDAEEVGRATFALARRLRDRLQSLPGQIGPEVIGLTSAEAVRLLQQEIDKICDEIAGPTPGKNGKKEDH